MKNNDELGPIVLELKNRFRKEFKNGLAEYVDNNRTYQISLGERSGGTWRLFHNFFFKLCEEFEDKMIFEAPGCRKCLFNGDSSIHFFENGNVFLLFVEMNLNSLNAIYTISITKCSYNEKGLIEFNDYKNSLENKL